MVTLLPSVSFSLYLSLSISPSTPHAQYSKRLRASCNTMNDRFVQPASSEQIWECTPARPRAMPSRPKTILLRCFFFSNQSFLLESRLKSQAKHTLKTSWTLKVCSFHSSKQTPSPVPNCYLHGIFGLFFFFFNTSGVSQLFVFFFLSSHNSDDFVHDKWRCAERSWPAWYIVSPWHHRWCSGPAAISNKGWSTWNCYSGNLHSRRGKNTDFQSQVLIFYEKEFYLSEKNWARTELEHVSIVREQLTTRSLTWITIITLYGFCFLVSARKAI